MRKVLELYSRLLEKHNRGARFIDEIFLDEIYKESRPKLTIIDLGAFEGEFSFYCLPFSSKIYAIEPDPRPYVVMKDLINEFELGNIIKTFPIAISGENGGRVLHASGQGGSALLAKGNTFDKPVEVNTLTLNDFLLQEKIDQVDILKIDVESSEGEIFGAPDFPEAATKIKYIIGEDHGGNVFEKMLAPLGFAVKAVGAGVWEARK